MVRLAARGKIKGGDDRDGNPPWWLIKPHGMDFD
jgi:hypothetical protein